MPNTQDVFIGDFKTEYRAYNNFIFFDIFKRDTDGVFTFVGILHAPYMGAWYWNKKINESACDEFYALLIQTEEYIRSYEIDGSGSVAVYHNTLGNVHIKG